VDDPDRVTELARAIRSDLPRLLALAPGGERTAATIDERLSNLLNGGMDAAELETEILDLLSAPATVRKWAEGFLATGLPPENQRSQFGPLAGAGELRRPSRYVCPIGNDQVFYRRTVGIAVPNCRTHGVPLVPGPTE
jgi:hypothetical protein